MNKPKTTAKDFFLWFGAMIAFYWSVIAFIFLIFDYISYWFPNALTYYPADPYQSGISYEMASVIVMLPLFMFLMRLIRKDIEKDSSRKEIWVRRSALIFTLFVAGVTIAADLITLLTSFLNGEDLTTAFLLKVLVIFAVAAKVFWYFISDLRGYWERFPGRRHMVTISVAVVAVIVIIAGFFIVGTPAQARAERFDAQRISDLQTLESQVINYYQAKQSLPTSMNDLNDSLSYGPLPTDPETGAPYIYQTSGALSFKLCATFDGQSSAIGMTQPSAPMPDGADVSQENWQHGSGQVCFDRTIDPSFYPPLK